MSTAFIAGLAMGGALLVAVAVGACRVGPESAEEQAFRKELGDATPILHDVLTEKQRVHSRLYPDYHLTLAGQGTIDDLIAKNPDKRVLGEFVCPGLGPALLEPETPESYFGNLANSADAIILGTVKRKTSLVTEDRAFVFTDYDVSVTRVFKNNPSAPIGIGAGITVTRPGGKVLLRGVVISVYDSNVEPLSVNTRVVLFLTFIPETGAYQAAKADGGFELDGSSVRPLTADRFPPGVLGNTDDFLQTLASISE
jgi:hypothetical protein